jgi:hypothetical protein
VLQFVLGKLFEKQKEMKTSKAFLRSIDQFCIMNADPKGLILEPELVPFLTKMGINVRRHYFLTQTQDHHLSLSFSLSHPVAVACNPSPSGHSLPAQRYDGTRQHQVRLPPETQVKIAYIA